MHVFISSVQHLCKQPARGAYRRGTLNEFAEISFPANSSVRAHKAARMRNESFVNNRPEIFLESVEKWMAMLAFPIFLQIKGERGGKIKKKFKIERVFIDLDGAVGRSRWDEEISNRHGALSLYFSLF